MATAARSDQASPGETSGARTGLASAVVRVGVIACVCVAGVAGVLKLDDALGLFDARADRNSALSYEARTYPDAEWIAGDPDVLEAARRLIPADASYRVVTGSLYPEQGYSSFALNFPKHILLPRVETTSDRARWILCYGCTRSELAPEFEVLAGVYPGLVLGRLKR